MHTIFILTTNSQVYSRSSKVITRANRSKPKLSVSSHHKYINSINYIVQKSLVQKYSNLILAHTMSFHTRKQMRLLCDNCSLKRIGRYVFFFWSAKMIRSLSVFYILQYITLRRTASTSHLTRVIPTNCGPPGGLWKESLLFWYNGVRRRSFLSLSFSLLRVFA